MILETEILLVGEDGLILPEDAEVVKKPGAKVVGLGGVVRVSQSWFFEFSGPQLFHYTEVGPINNVGVSWVNKVVAYFSNEEVITLNGK